MSSAILSDRQRSDLHASIAQYLSFHFPGVAGQFRTEAKLEQPQNEAEGEGILAKKWASVIRLQKRIMDLESKHSQLVAELSQPRPSTSTISASTWVPSPSSRSELKGHRASVNCVVFHPILESLASAGDDCDIRIWDYSTGLPEQTLRGHTKTVLSLDFSPGTGDHLISASADLNIRIWDTTQNYACIRTLIGHDHSVSSCSYLTGGKILSASRDKSIKMWDAQTGYCTATFNQDDWVRCVTASEDGVWIASGSNDQTARVTNAISGEVKADLRGHSHVIECVAFVPSHSYAAIRELAGLSESSIASESKSDRPGMFLATGSRDKTINIWDSGNGLLIRTLKGHDNWVRGLCFHPNLSLLLSVSDDKSMRFWDLKSGRCIKSFEAHGHFVTSIAWGRALIGSGVNEQRVNVVATGGVDQTIRVCIVSILH